MSKNNVLGILGIIFSFLISFILFKGSIWMALIIYGVICMYLKNGDEKGEYEKKFLVTRTICTFGLVLLIIGNVGSKNDLLIITGGAMVACTLAPLVVIEFVQYYKKNRK